MASDSIMSDGVVPYGSRRSICVRRLVSLCLGVIVGVKSVMKSVFGSGSSDECRCRFRACTAWLYDNGCDVVSSLRVDIDGLKLELLKLVKVFGVSLR